MILASQTFSEMVLPRLTVAGTNPIATKQSVLWVTVGQRRQGMRGKRTKGKQESLNSSKEGVRDRGENRKRVRETGDGEAEAPSMPHGGNPQRFSVLP